jgi:hypothetical protein
MKGLYESKDSIELDKENSIVNDKMKTEEFSQIDINLKGKTGENKSAAAAENQKKDQPNAIENNPDNIVNNQEGINKEIVVPKRFKYETLDESYLDTFVINRINNRKEILIEFCIN